MSKLWLVLLPAMIGALIWTGVLEVNFKLSQLPELPAITNTLLKERATYEKSRVYLVGLKRKGEMLFIRDKEKRLVLSLLYVKNDAAKLEELINQNATPDSLLPQAELLISSINQVRLNAQKAPVEVVASLKKDSTQTFARAQSALGQLKQQNDEYAKINQEFTRLTKSLEQQIGALGLDQPSPDVAGTRDENQTEE